MWKKIFALFIGVLVGYWLIDDFNPDVLKGKRVVVTGSSTGIGEQIAYHYARMGAQVLVTARRENILKQVVARCKELGPKDGKYFYKAADMVNMSATKDVIQEAYDRLGGIDILILNHILPIPLGMWDGSPQNLSLTDKIVDVNFKAYVHLTSHALPHLVASNGSLIVVSSLAGKIGQPFTAVYSATKFALDGFFGALRQEFKLKGCDVSITLCVIGLVGTENAIRGLRDYGQHFLLAKLPAETPSDTALAIIKGGARRQREIYHPYLSMRVMTFLRDWLPNVVEYINRSMFTVPP
ncbi:hydroxysteroid 11-beta-dehydrogenase 1-like protein [Saccostrea echinata]|uniref:hydroxysteroid 11-beta-dehydrogenase 1-like protein n=1 Tax=Saccostrea echinata TaxID=191078 RepID=UPI002A82D3AF|nr:hydroxysteroid 11-beta-dehydrogenase 1-like protein [Saccostrea echinata]